MYPWKEAVASWAGTTQLRIDALGIITMLGTEEINASTGRLLSSRYVEFLPYLGAFVIAGDRFRTKPPGFTLYEMEGGFKTTELSGWFARWLKAQDFHQIHHQVEWKILDEAEQKVAKQKFVHSRIAALCIGIVFNSILLAASVLAGDWWGFANVSSMVMSVLVRIFLVDQNRHGIDLAIDLVIDLAIKREQKIADSENNERPPATQSNPTEDDDAITRPSPPTRGNVSRTATDPLKKLAKALVVLDDSKCVYIQTPEYLIPLVFAATADVPSKWAYRVVRCIGWMAFAVQVVSLGMSTLLIQIGTIILLLSSSVLVVTKFGCEDSKIWKTMYHYIKFTASRSSSRESPTTAFDPLDGMKCVIGSKLQATSSRIGPTHPSSPNLELEKDPEAGRPPAEETKRRQDLFVWLRLSETKENLLKQWDLLPSGEQAEGWWREYTDKKDKYAKTNA